MQIQDANSIEAMQAVRPLRTYADSLGRSLDPNWHCCSFELGGDKKTKGAALTFVRHIFNPARVIIPTCYAVTTVLYSSAMCSHSMRLMHPQIHLLLCQTYVPPSMQLGMIDCSIIEYVRQCNNRPRGTNNTPMVNMSATKKIAID